MKNIQAKISQSAREFWYSNEFQTLLKETGSTFVSVTFVKSNGELTTRTFNPTSWNPTRLLGRFLRKNENGKPMNDARPYEAWGNVPFMDMNAYKSGANPVKQFKLDRLQSVRVSGIEYTFTTV